MMPKEVKTDTDERAVFVHDTSYSFAFKITYVAVVIDILYRYFINRESSWDLLIILALSGLTVTIYQVRYKALTRSLVRTLIMFTFAPLIAIIVLLFIR